MFTVMQRKIRTERLTLRRWKKSDYGDFVAFTADEEVMALSGSGPARSEREARRAFDVALSDEDNYAVVLNETGRAVGKIKFQTDFRRHNINSLSVGYELAKEYWGNGYMTEALQGMIKEAFELRRADVLAISHFSVNFRSRRVIEKCGFRCEGTVLRAFRRYDGAVFDDVCYSILKEDYFADRQKYIGTGQIKC